MKKLLGTITALMMLLPVLHRSTITGKVVTNKTGRCKTLRYKLHSDGKKEKAVSQMTRDFFNSLTLNPNTNAKLIVQYVGMKTHEENFTATGNKSFNIVLESLDYFFEPLEVKAIRASDKAHLQKRILINGNLRK